MGKHEIPDHIPAELVIEFDYREATSGKADPYAALLELAKNGAPPLFYTPFNGGHWVATSYETVSELFRDYKTFSTYPSFIPPMPNQPRLVPQSVDPPDHTRYKRLLGGMFSPAATARMEADIRATSAALIEPFARSGTCDFVRDYAHIFPAHIFLRFMGMPVEKCEEFVDWAKQVLTSETPAEKLAAANRIYKFIEDFVDAKTADPGDDWASVLINAKDADGSPALNREEILNISYLLFLGGLDTAANAHAHTWRWLGAHPDAQRALRADPEAIPSAMEEMLRLFAITNNSRKVREDMDFMGVPLKKGDPILLLVELANRDPAQFQAPDDAVLDREENLHLTFGAGIHRCLGSNLARMELRVSMEEWNARIPEFRLGDQSQVRSIGGTTMGYDSLPLVWDVIG